MLTILKYSTNEEKIVIVLWFNFLLLRMRILCKVSIRWEYTDVYSNNFTWFYVFIFWPSLRIG